MSVVLGTPHCLGNELVKESSERSATGHPRGLTFLAISEGLERFAFFGMSAILLLYMVQYLFSASEPRQIFGLHIFRQMIEAVTGPLSTLAFASQVAGLYSGLAFLSPVLGGYLADRWLGQRYTVLLGGILMAIGHFLMAMDKTFLVAILTLIAGAGCLKGNISTQVGHLYSSHDESRRTRGFAIYNAAINVGSFSGSALCAVVAQVFGWSAGFLLAAAVMTVSLATYVAAWQHLPKDVKGAEEDINAPLTSSDWRVLGMLAILTVVQVVGNIALYQEVNIGVVFIQESVSRQFLLWQVPASAFSSLKFFFGVAFVGPVIFLWRWQQRRGREPSDPVKLVIGYMLMALANLVMVVPSYWIDVNPSLKVSVLWPIALYALNALGGLYYWPTSLALFSSSAPPKLNSTVMGVLLAAAFPAYTLVGYIGTLWEEISRVNFFLLHAGFAAVAMLLSLAIVRPAQRILGVR